MKTPVIIALAVSAISSIAAFAQTGHQQHGGTMDHSGHQQHVAASAPVLSEPGQGAFAAISEVVRVLEADPETDWSKVDLAALRDHLVDMDHLITHSAVKETKLTNGITALVSGDANTLASLKRMVPAHAEQLAADGRWAVATTLTEEGVELKVTSDDPATVARIQGLGFFGLMASQDHHREHHLMIARGENVHRH